MKRKSSGSAWHGSQPGNRSRCKTIIESDLSQLLPALPTQSSRSNVTTGRVFTQISFDLSFIFRSHSWLSHRRNVRANSSGISFDFPWKCWNFGISRTTPVWFLSASTGSIISCLRFRPCLLLFRVSFSPSFSLQCYIIVINIDFFFLVYVCVYTCVYGLFFDSCLAEEFCCRRSTTRQA